MSIKQVATQADQFGNWHVRVVETGIGDLAAARNAALAAVRDELDPPVDGLVLNHRDSVDGLLISYYDER